MSDTLLCVLNEQFTKLFQKKIKTYFVPNIPRTSEENFYSADEKYKFVHKADGEFTIMTLLYSMQRDEVVDLKANNIKLSNV